MCNELLCFFYQSLNNWNLEAALTGLLVNSKKLDYSVVVMERHGRMAIKCLWELPF